MAILIPHPLTDLQGLDGTLLPIGHLDAGAGHETGLGIGLIQLPLMVAEVIAQRGGKQGQGDGRAHQQSTLAGLESGQ